MKIIKRGTIPEDREEEKIETEFWCVCPVCSESKTLMHYVKKGIVLKGLSRTLFPRRYTKGLHTYKGNIYIYRCNTCGTEWESEIFNVREYNFFGREIVNGGKLK